MPKNLELLSLHFAAITGQLAILILIVLKLQNNILKQAKLFMSINLSELSARQGLKNNLFDRLGKLAQQTGTPGQEELEILANEFLIGKANTYGTASFYDFLKPENKGKKVYVCNGTACKCAGTQDNLTTKLKEHFNANEIGDMTCLGRCHENSAFHYKGKNYSGSSLNQLANILSKTAD